MPRQDMNGMGQDVADKAGVYRNYFYRLRATNPECFEYMKALCPTDMARAYHKYMKHKQEATNKACDIYYELEDAGLIYMFGEFLVERGVYTNRLSYERTKTTIFKLDGVKVFKSLLTIIKSNELYEEFRYERKCS